MKFNEFWTNLKNLEESISIQSPTPLKVIKAYWGAPAQSITDLPVALNALSEPDRTLGFGSREERVNVNFQLLVARATVEDDYSSLLATAFWYAAKDIFDRNTTIGNTVALATLKGAVSRTAGQATVPVVLSHGGQAYIGFNAVLDMQVFEPFTF